MTEPPSPSGSQSSSDLTRPSLTEPSSPTADGRPGSCRMVTIRDLIEVIKETVRCPICLDVMRVTTTLQCGHAFCETCVRKALNEFHIANCFLCNQEITKQPTFGCEPIDELVNVLFTLNKEGKVCLRCQVQLHLFDLNRRLACSEADRKLGWTQQNDRRGEQGATYS